MSDEILEPVAPTIEKVVETHETTTTKGDANQLQADHPSTAVDDEIRRKMGLFVLWSDGLTAIVVIGMLFLFSNYLAKETFGTVATLAGGIIGYRARDTSTVINYIFGSSSGSAQTRNELLARGRP